MQTTSCQAVTRRKCNELCCTVNITPSLLCSSSGVIPVPTSFRMHAILTACSFEIHEFVESAEAWMHFISVSQHILWDSTCMQRRYVLPMLQPCNPSPKHYLMTASASVVIALGNRSISEWRSGESPTQPTPTQFLTLRTAFRARWLI